MHVSLFNKIVYTICTPAGLISQTWLAAEKQQRFFKNRTRIKVIHNGVKKVILYPETKRQKKILAVGRLNDHLKGFDRLIEAFAIIKDQDWQLVFAGPDEKGEHLKNQAYELGVHNRVRFLGQVKDMDRLYAEAGIFVIPSRSEGFPNALCEAMAAGLPSISFDFCAGPRELINSDENGLIVPDGDINSLAGAIDYLISEPKERDRLGNKAMEIRDRLDANKIADQWLAFI
jgi:glycosyltransferase involved in cell wall biosynthesis